MSHSDSEVDDAPEGSEGDDGGEEGDVFADAETKAVAMDDGKFDSDDQMDVKEDAKKVGGFGTSVGFWK